MGFKPWTFDYRGVGVEAYASGSVGDVMNVLMCMQVSCLKTRIQRNETELNAAGCTRSIRLPMISRFVAFER
jgi:hypothetical protein